MARVGLVLGFERTTNEEGAHLEEVRVDPGGGDTTVEHYGNSGDDAPPLPGDFAALDDSVGAGAEKATGYNDPKNPGKALPGEKRIYARDADGNVVAEIWLKGSGSITVENGSGTITMGADGTVNINGVEIDTSGNIVAPGEVTAMAAAAGVKLSQHKHGTAMGPTSPPLPG